MVGISIGRQFHAHTNLEMMRRATVLFQQYLARSRPRNWRGSKAQGLTRVMLEFVTTNLPYTMAKDAITAIRHGRRRLSASEIIARRQKWKPLFEQEIWKTHRDKLRQDAIVRDMKRIDHYPDAKSPRYCTGKWASA